MTPQQRWGGHEGRTAYVVQRAFDWAWFCPSETLGHPTASYLPTRHNTRIATGELSLIRRKRRPGPQPPSPPAPKKNMQTIVLPLYTITTNVCCSRHRRLSLPDIIFQVGEEQGSGSPVSGRGIAAGCGGGWRRARGGTDGTGTAPPPKDSLPIERQMASKVRKIMPNRL